MRMRTSTASAQQTALRGGWYEALANHWPEYLMEGAALGLFMISACVFTVLLEHPSSWLHQAIPSPVLRRLLNGVAMGCTAIGLIYSPWGKRSGAHMNPSVTLTFLSLGKIQRWDAIFYVTAQFVGGLFGVVLAAVAIGLPVRHSAVNYVVTVPGAAGPGIAFWAEFLISFLMMSMILFASNTKRLERFTGVFAGFLLAAFITFEAPLSGMSINPARTLGSAIAANEWTALWVYFSGPPLGMLVASVAYRLRRGASAVFCAKLHHHNDKRCIFRCNYAAM